MPSETVRLPTELIERIQRQVFREDKKGWEMKQKRGLVPINSEPREPSKRAAVEAALKSFLFWTGADHSENNEPC